MNEYNRLLVLARNADLSVTERVKTLHELSRLKEVGVIADLKRFLNRAVSTVPFEVKGSDPAGEERVVNMHAVAALCQLGDTSEIDRIAPLVAGAGRILSGPDDEIINAALVIYSIGSVEPIKQIVLLCDSRDRAVVRNAVRTLNQLKLPQAPTGGTVGTLPHFSETVTFEISRFSEEMEAIEKLSKGSIILSEDTKKFIKANDYDRGSVKREEVTLTEIVEQDIDMLDLCYFVERNKVVIGTYEEAGKRWKDWGERYDKNLAYDKKNKRFVLLR